ncbi:MAG: TIGR00282 family metallophosphoesterase [Cyanobacteriota bacterium]
MNDTIKILFLGDIVGRPGRFAVKYFIQNIESFLTEKPDFIFANCENASHGFGLTEKNYNELIEASIDLLTSGNHIWDRKEIYSYIDKAPFLIRPINYPENTPGKGSSVVTKNGVSVAVINFLGRIFMDPYESPWVLIKDEILKLQSITPIVIIDFHAEATAEKIAFGYYLSDLGASAMIGTHTHVPTADETILNDCMAYITDVGYCGAVPSVIGMDIDSSIKKLSSLLPSRYEVPPVNEAVVCGALISINANTGVSSDIQRIKYQLDLKKLIEEDKIK